MGHPGDLKNLNELDDYQVGADDADPRGWQVTATDGRGIGRVADLIVDTDSMKVRYLDVEVDRALSPTATACGVSVTRGRWLPTFGVAAGAFIAAGALEFAGTVAISKLLAPEAPILTVISLVVGLTTMAIGGYFAAWVRPDAATVMAAIVMIVVGVLMMTMSGSASPWFGLAFLILGPLAALAGGALCGWRTGDADRAV